MQKFKFPMEYLRVTQGENDVLSHAGSLAMDFGGKDTGADKLYCPCDMVVKRCRKNANGELYLESTLPVEFADGTKDYVRLICIHDGVFNVVEGQVLKQGDYFYDEGGMGSGNSKAFATHVHIEAGKGKWNSTTQSPNSQGTYVIERQEHLYDLFILGDDVQILDDGGYPWKRVSDLEKTAAEDDIIYGVDVSHNRSVNIIAKVKANGKADFAILRATVGSVDQDANLAQYIKDCQGMKIGFFSANYFNTVEDAIAEADYLVDTVESYGFTPKTVDLPLFCDWEYFSHEYWKKQGVEITPEQLREMTGAFCGRIIERGYRAGVYLNHDFWKNWYGDDFFKDNPELYIWYARPGVDKPDRDCYIWQYACDMGTEYGADEPLDKNILMGDYLKAEIAVDCKECAELKEKLEIAAKQIKSNDFYIQQLKTEKLNLEADIYQLKTEMAAIEAEKGVLKETIISLQEQLTGARQPKPEKKCLLEKILDILFGDE